MLTNFKNSVNRLIKNWVRANVETIIPGKVIDITGYESTQQIKVVQPLLNLIFEDNQAVEMPFIYNVPVALLGTKESLFSVPIKVGDTVELHFSKRSISQLKEQAEAIAHNPRERRYFDTADAIAYPSVLNKPANLNPSASHVEIKFNDILISYQEDGTILADNGTGALEISPTGVMTYTSSPVSVTVDPVGNLANITAATITLNGNVNITQSLVVTNNVTATGGTTALGATVTSAGVNIGSTHIHSSGTLPSGNTGAPV